MTQNQWTKVDDYVVGLLSPSDSVLDAALADSDAGGLPPINVAPNQGKLLEILAASHGAKRILEIGTLGGYSTIWLARALPAFPSLQPKPHAAIPWSRTARTTRKMRVIHPSGFRDVGRLSFSQDSAKSIRRRALSSPCLNGAGRN